MTKIKIISNPYKKEIKYQNWNKRTSSWEDITVESDPNSKLVSKEFKDGFFPFKVKKIVDQIIKDYQPEKIEIVFEGTDDEFKELSILHNYEDYSSYIDISKSELGLENARDILPEIRKIFKEKIHPLVDESISDISMVQKDLDKFSDASNEIIPICVLGNYSAGKSTFINALIGREVLPSAERPTTAKIFKIAQESSYTRAEICFGYLENEVRISLLPDSFRIDSEINNKLLEKLNETLTELAQESICKKLKEILEIVNEFERDMEEGCISDLIEINVPFQRGIWNETENQFVIFDTPGSNSASNFNHFEVLKKAMEGLTNGIPIFVTKYDQLDTTDNEKLFEEINGMKELDNRFAMIVVNKADTSSLPKEGFSDRDRREIMKQAVPKKMFSNGIYFVSSIMGLGFKNDGNFMDDHSAEIFEDNKEKYFNSQSRFYKTLYNYNIMPEQLKKDMVEHALESKDLIFANSGLYSVESEIQMFANKHAAYNKCEQSNIFLRNVIEITSEDIKKVKEEHEESQNILQEKLDEEKQILVKRIDEKSKEQEEIYIQKYLVELKKVADQSIFSYSDEEIRNRDKELTKQYKDKFDYAKEGQDIKEAIGGMATELKDNVSEFVGKFSLDSLKKIGKGLVDSLKNVTEETEEWNEARIKAETEAGDYLVKEIERDFDDRFNKAKQTIEETSKSYWEEATEAIRSEFSSLIAGAKELTEEKRKELSEIIIKYHNIIFVSHSDEKFAKEHFEKKFTLLGETGKLNLWKLRWTYNTSMQEDVNEVYAKICSDHENEFRKWLYNLFNILQKNIVDYSPELHELSIKIQEEREHISDLEFRYDQLQNYSNSIKNMMEWKVQ